MSAQLHTDFMASNKNLTHEDPSGDLGKRIDDQGFDWWRAGENIARGFEEYDDEGVMHAWMNSPGHRANILDSKFTHFGSGFRDTYWTQNFAQDVNGRPPNVPKCPTETKSEDNDDGMMLRKIFRKIKKITISFFDI